MLAKKIILGAVLSFLVIAGSWYYHNQTAKNIVSGVVADPLGSLKSEGGRTNVLLLGIGGQGHEGGDLTDSILVVSFNLSGNTATMIPIPRDIWIPSMKAKINTAYHYGNDRRADGGLDLAKSGVSEILDIPIHYALTLDFQGFVKAIDAVGGVDVNVERSFDDFKYPIPGKETSQPESSRYEHLHFDSGMTHMDGTTALKFARSRHAEGDEGTDFARGSRQQKIILAFKDKLFSTGTIFGTNVITKLKESVSSSIDTDITSREYGGFFKVFLGLGSKDNIASLSLAEKLTSPKSTKEYLGQWVLVPTGSWEEIHAYVAQELSTP
jgi:LCP family protein required for cell wall assembly